MNNQTFIIAEAGVNHNGDVNLAKKLIDEASHIGADAIKFQTFIPENMVTKYSLKAEYQKKEKSDSESQFEMLKKLSLDFNSFKFLKNYTEKKNIIFLSSPFDIESINLLHKLGLNLLKIPSGEITNLPYLRKIGSYNKKIILSTGMSSLREIKDALLTLKNAGTDINNISLLHTNTHYPTPFHDANLNAIKTLSRKFRNIKIGFSDHTEGIEASIAAVAIGAKIIEKHLTLNKSMTGPDHKASIEPLTFQSMVIAIRNIEKALGDGVKKITLSEINNLEVVRKSIVAKIPIKKGEYFSENNLTVKRPGHGLSPMKWDLVIGTRARKNYDSDELI